MIFVVLVIIVIARVNMCGSDDSGDGGCVSDKCDTYSKYVW